VRAAIVFWHATHGVVTKFFTGFRASANPIKLPQIRFAGGLYTGICLTTQKKRCAGCLILASSRVFEWAGSAFAATG
jgi:hypothetical protein